jgi:hypothetical protein
MKGNHSPETIEAKDVTEDLRHGVVLLNSKGGAANMLTSEMVRNSSSG